MTHWSAVYIGQPWSADRDHCWAFVRRVWAERFGLDVPEIVADASSPLVARREFAKGQEGWRAVDDPAEGDAVLMAKGARACHVGIWVTPERKAGVLHSIERTGVIFTAVGRLAALGYQVAGYYRRAG